MEIIVKETTFLPGLDHGWGNGYVVLPKGHKYHGKDYDEIDVDVHYGLTFSRPATDLEWPEITEAMKDCWIIGFDTAHTGDTQYTWPKEAVIAEAKRLMEQL